MTCREVFIISLRVNVNHNEEVLTIRADATSVTTVLYKINVVHVKVYITL